MCLFEVILLSLTCSISYSFIDRQLRGSVSLFDTYRKLAFFPCFTCISICFIIPNDFMATFKCPHNIYAYLHPAFGHVLAALEADSMTCCILKRRATPTDGSYQVVHQPPHHFYNPIRTGNSFCVVCKRNSPQSARLR